MKKLFSLLLILFLITGVSFAGSESEGSKGGDSKGSITIGVTIETFDDVFMQNVKDAVEQKADEMGVTVRIVDAKGDPAEQIKQVDNFITNKVDAIIVHVINADIVSTITQKALDADIPLVYMNRPAEIPSGEKVAVVASPEIEAGRGQAKYVVDTLATQGVTSGNVVILLGGLGSAPQIGRTQGVKDYLSENASGFTVTKEQTATWKRPEAVAVVENWLASGDDFVAVFANNDEMALGAALAIKEAGLKDEILIVGVDATSDAIAAIDAGDMDMTMFQDGRSQGSGSVEVAIKMATGESFDQNVSIPFAPVTAANTADFK